MSKTVLITGATSGIGLAAAESIAAQGHRLVLIGRDRSKLQHAATRARAAGAVGIDTLSCDFADLGAVRALAGEVLDRYTRIDVLINNAGAVYAERTETRDGLEATFAVNHLAGFLLTELLRERLVASAPARILFTVSTGHYRGTMDFDDLEYRSGYSIFAAYCRSKLANVVYARELAAQLSGTGVTVNAVHPGTVASNIWGGAPWFARPLLRLAARLFMDSPQQGVRTLVRLALDPDVEAVTGQYFEDDTPAQPSALATDEQVAARLRRASEALVALPS